MLPVLIDFGFLKVYATGAIWGISVLIAGITASRAAYRKGYHPMWVWDLVAYAFIGGLIFGRVGYFITQPGALAEGPMEILRVWKGGMSLHWGVLGGFIVAYIHSRRYGLSFIHFADTWAPALVLGLAISRFGCLLGGHCFGIPCEDSCFLAITYPTGQVVEGVPITYPTDGIPRHPAQVYHIVANLIVYLILLRLQLWDVKPGRVFAGFFIFYSVGRFITEYWRDDMVESYFGLTVAQVASVVIIVIGLIMWWLFGWLAKRDLPITRSGNFSGECKVSENSDA